LKSIFVLSLLLLTLPVWVPDFRKDKMTVFASLSYYKCDFDADKKEDLALWHPKTNTLYFQLTSDGKFYEKKFFDAELNYSPVFADYDGDGKTDFAFYQVESGQWIFYLSKEGLQKTFLGGISDIPIPTDINGDMIYSLSIWRPNAGLWVLTEKTKSIQSDDSEPEIIPEGNFQDSAFSGDYDGDGKSDLIVWRPDDGYWHVVRSRTGFDFEQSDHIQHGKEWDIIVPNDYDNDGRCDLVFWRPSEQTWYFLYAGSQNQNQIKFGEKNDIPLSADLDSDGSPELITWNAVKKSWNILNLKKHESNSYKWDVPEGCIPAVSIIQKYE